ncbi:hypothetical protein AB0I60_06000 [Actinosynnema sp. NPDC050436]|uniref:hypothetical protein n=1 Tax=Actinosynnema sp. NPDC050436 TaxID=3155659 RepID=UPI0033C75C58
MRRRVAAVAAVLGVVVAGCSGAPAPDTAPTSVAGTSPVPATGLATALTWVTAADPAVIRVEYGDGAAVRELVARNGRFVSLEGYGYGPLHAHSAALADIIGVDPRKSRQALRVTVVGERIGVLRSDFDVAAVNAKFEALSAQKGDSKDGVTSWLTGVDGAAPGSPLARREFAKAFNQVRVGPERFEHTTAATAVSWTDDPGSSLLADRGLAGLARCLGEVTAALVQRPSYQPFVGAGVRVVDGKPSEVVCTPTRDAEAHLRRVRERLASPTWAAVFPGATAEVPADQPDVVRVVAPDDGTLKIGRAAEAIGGGGELFTLVK